MMPTYQEFGDICMACPLKQQDGGFRVCGADGRNIISHAAAEKCAEGRYALPRAKPVAPVASKGLGDTIARITAATGIDKVVKAVASAVGAEDCGCNKRREALNELVPYGPANK